MVSAEGYVPERGHAVWLSLYPQAGHEQAGRRPVLVLSPATYNARTSLALLCPITTQVKGYPFEVSLPEGLPVRGVVLSDQLKSLDWRARQAEWICRIPRETVMAVLGKLGRLLAA